MFLITAILVSWNHMNNYLTVYVYEILLQWEYSLTVIKNLDVQLQHKARNGLLAQCSIFYDY